MSEGVDGFVVIWWRGAAHDYEYSAGNTTIKPRRSTVLRATRSLIFFNQIRPPSTRLRGLFRSFPMYGNRFSISTSKIKWNIPYFQRTLTAPYLPLLFFHTKINNNNNNNNNTDCSCSYEYHY